MMILEGQTVKGINEQQEAQLLRLKSIYDLWNPQINVISRKDMDKFNVHHVLHSLSISQVFDFPDNTRLLDLGCGGGFPGIPLAIVFPEVSFHLVDSTRKKIKVVEEVVKELDLKNVTFEHIRVENITNQKFDGVLSRAVAPLKTLLEWSCPLLHKNSEFGLICLKGGDLTNEIKDAKNKVKQWPLLPDIFQDEWFEDKYLLQVKCQ